ncbi:hypothetical protein EDD86DRAFT_196598, partial [Gorgonomyces haynaldii]
MKAIVIGGSGMTGRKVVKELAERDMQVTLLLRKEFKDDSWKMENVKTQIIDFDNMSKLPEDLFKADVAVNCLGTTRHDAGSAEAFVRIDYEYPMEFAKRTRQYASHFLSVGSGAPDKNSWLLYPKTKGRLEHGIQELGFPKTSLFRPGLLLFPGEQRPRDRTLEGFAIAVSNFFGIKSFTCETAQLGKVIAHVAQKPHSEKVKIYENDQINNFKC